MPSNRTASAPASLHGRHILALGAALGPQRDGPLAGTSVEVGGVAQLEQLAPGACDLVLIDADAFDATALATAMKAISAMRPAPPLLVVGESLPTALVRNVLRMEAADILEAPYTPEQLAAAVQGLLTEAQPALAPTGGDSRCWAISGAVGGSGATTITIEIAHALATASGKDRSVCLVDLNLADGACAAYLGAQPTLKLADFGTLRRPDRRLHAAGRCHPGVQGPRSNGRRARRQRLRQRRPRGRAASAGSRLRVLRVGDPRCAAPPPALDPGGAGRLRRGAGDLRAHRSGAAGRARLFRRDRRRQPGIAPPHRPEPAGQPHVRPGADHDRGREGAAAQGRSRDQLRLEAAAASANLGGPIAQHRPKSKIVKDVQTLVERLVAQPARREPAPKAA
jgi:pilus assembly protein CpaE